MNIQMRLQNGYGLHYSFPVSDYLCKNKCHSAAVSSHQSRQIYTENEQSCDLQFTMILQICQTNKKAFFFLGNSNNVEHFRKFQSLPSEISPKLLKAMKVAGCFAQCGSMRNQVESKPHCSHSTVKHFAIFEHDMYAQQQSYVDWIS